MHPWTAGRAVNRGVIACDCCSLLAAKPGALGAIQPAMTTRTFLFSALLTSLSGCVLQTGGGDDEAVESSDFSELDEVVARHSDEHNRLPNNVPVFDATGVFTTISSSTASSTSTTSSSRTSAATAGAASAATCRPRAGPSPRASCRACSTPPTAARSRTASASARCSAPTTAPTRPTPTSRPWPSGAARTACCSSAA